MYLLQVQDLCKLELRAATRIATRFACLSLTSCLLSCQNDQKQVHKMTGHLQILDNGIHIEGDRMWYIWLRIAINKHQIYHREQGLTTHIFS